MKLTSNIKFKNFILNSPKKNLKSLLVNLLNQNNEIFNSLDKSYKDSFNLKKIKIFKKSSITILIGMGGSILGAKTIYNFLNDKIKKKFFFIDHFQNDNKKNILNKKKLNIIISKSGNTLETITNSNTIINNKDNNIFITEKKKVI